MKLVAAAIKFTLLNEFYPFIVTAKRHADVFEKLYKLNITYDKSTAVQGFLTDTNQFVDRYEAKKIAVAANQLIVPLEDTYAELFSEDVW